MDCNHTPCAALPNEYEDDWHCILVDWLEKVTCVRWVYRDQDAARPEGQHGSVHFDTIDVGTTQRNDAASQTEDRVCVSVESQVEVDVDLRVYGLSQMPTDNGQKLRRPADVLMRVLDGYYRIPKLRVELQKYGIAFNSNARINNYQDEIQSGLEYRSSVSITLCITRQTSFPDDLIKGFRLNFDCTDCEKNNGN